MGRAKDGSSNQRRHSQGWEKKPGDSDLRGCFKQTKVNMNLFGLIMGMLFDPLFCLLKAWLVQFVYEVSKYCSGTFGVNIKFAFELFQ